MARSAKKYVYYFGNGKADGTGKMKDLLGGKGAGLANMTNLKIPGPPGSPSPRRRATRISRAGRSIPPACGSRCSPT
jgi:pyruvate,orthophosphate dikinase